MAFPVQHNSRTTYPFCGVAFVFAQFLKNHIHNGNEWWSWLHRLQVMKHSWGSLEQQNCGFGVLHSIFQSLSACFPYIMDEHYSWCAVTLWLIFWAVPSLMIVVNYRLVPIWPFLFGEASMGFQAATKNKIIGEWKMADFSWAFLNREWNCDQRK